MLEGLPPLAGHQTRFLVLGSFPGAASLAAEQYYAHPRNQFWPLMEAIWPPGPVPQGMGLYEFRCQWLLSRGVGLWDVYASCRRSGSLDSSIRAAVPNDFSQLTAACPLLEAVGHNGSESFRLAPLLPASVQVYRLPSTSPAHAAWRFERKLAAWRAVFERHGLIGRQENE